MGPGLTGRCLLALRTIPKSSGVRVLSTLNGKSENCKILNSRVQVNIGVPDHNATIAVINMNDIQTRNSLSKDNVYAMLDTLNHLQEEIANGTPIRALILKSNVPNVFCAGANLKERQAMSKTQVESWLKVQRSLMDSISDFLYPTIAAIDGHALGGGLELALACDMRIVNEKAKVGLVETRLAIIPGAGGTQRLARLIGVAKAKEHIFVAEPVDGAEAFRLGIANHLATGEDGSFKRAIEIAKKICKRGPKALRLAKAAIDNGSQASLDTGLDIENAYYGQLLDSADRSEGMRAFTEKREPLYTGN
jgi:methylglutaconyl-CoA hydratase